MILAGIIKKRGRPPKNPGNQPDFQSWDFQTALKETLKSIVEAKDSDGDPLYELFMDLPSKKDYPDYYQEIANPISINIIAKRISNNYYLTWESFLEDWILLTDNAKTYNKEGSYVYKDAVNISKIVNHLTEALKNNKLVMASKEKKEKKSQTVASETKNNKSPGNSKKKENLVIRLPVSVLDKQTPTPHKKSRKSRELSTKKRIDPSSNKDKDSLDSNSRIKSSNTSPHSNKFRSKRNDFSQIIASLIKSLEFNDFTPENLEKLNKIDPDSFGISEFDDQSFQWTLLHCASYYGRLVSVQTLVERGASLELRDDRFGSTALCWAAFGGNFEVCNYLITEAKADRGVKNCCDLTPLELCPNPDAHKWKNLLTMPLSDEKKNLTFLLRSRLHKNGRLLAKLLHDLTAYIPSNSQIPLAAPIMDLPPVETNREFYSHIPHPLSFNMILSRERAYRTIGLLEAHLYLVFDNYTSYYSPEHEIHQAAINLKKLYQNARDKLLRGEDGESLKVLNEEFPTLPIPTLFFNETIFAVGDFVYINDPETEKEINILMIADITQNEEEWLASGIGFKFLSQVPDSAEHDFLPNEIFKTGVRFTAPFSKLSKKCCVLSVKAFSTFVPRDFSHEDTFVCEFRLSNDDVKYHTIKDWSKTIGVFPFFPVRWDIRESPLIFSRPSFSAYDPQVISNTRTRKPKSNGGDKYPSKKRQKSSDFGDSSTPSFAPSPANSFQINRLLEQVSPDTILNQINNNQHTTLEFSKPDDLVSLPEPILPVKPPELPQQHHSLPSHHFIPQPNHGEFIRNQNNHVLPAFREFPSTSNFLKHIQVVGCYENNSHIKEYFLDAKLDSFCLTFDAPMLVFIPILSEEISAFHGSISFKLTVNHHEIFPFKSRIFPNSTSFHFPSYPGLNKIQLHATFLMETPNSSALISRNFMFFIHRV